MELHSQALNFLCRLCGGKLSKYSHNKFELKRKLEKVCDIDVKLRLHYNELAQRTATVWRYLTFGDIRC